MNRKLENSELERKSIDEFRKAQKTPLIIVLDNVRSLNNIGSIFRTADAFLVKKILLCGITAQPPHRDITKTALGATQTVAWEHYQNIEEAIQKLKGDGVNILAIEQAENSVALDVFDLKKGETYAVIFGNEVNGVQQEIVSMADTVIEIPQLGSKHSLNIAVSAGVVVWDLFVKMNSR